MRVPRNDRARTIKLFLTRVALTVERAAEVGWPLAGIIAAFVALALLEVPQNLGGWGHWAVLAAVAAGLVWSVRRIALGFRNPTADETLRRLETSSALEHRPLSTLRDDLANDADPVAREMWRAHQERIRAARLNLRVGEPRPVLWRVDPYGMHAVIGLVLVIGLVVAGDQARARLFDALTPRLDPATAERPTLDVWISPPAYTGKAPSLLTHRGNAAAASVTTDAVPAEGVSADGAAAPAAGRRVEIPVGSRLLATINGGAGTAELLVERADAPDGAQAGGTAARTPFASVGGNGFQVETTIDAASAIEVFQDGASLGRWQVAVLADGAPTIELTEEPTASERDVLSLRYAAEDDYGVVRSTVAIRRVDAESEAVTDEEPIVIPLALPRVAAERVEGKSFHDLTPHPWAGQPVEYVLRAEDDLGQVGQSAPVRGVLPERLFFHPVARAVIEQRKRLVVEPERRLDVAQILVALAARPQQYHEDIVVFLSLKTAAARLALSDKAEPETVGGTIAGVQEQLWDTALRIEDGEVSLAARRLRELERQLQEALANNAPQEEIERLMDQLQDAIDQYLDAMQQQMQEMMQRQAQQQGQQPQPMPQGQRLERQDLKDLVERARDLSRSGARDAAREMLSRLQEMMENLQAGMNPQMMPEQQAMQEMMRQLGEMAREQQQLLDQTFRQRQQMDNAGDQPSSRRNGQQSQNGLGGQRQGAPRRSGDQGLMTPDGGPQNQRGQMQSGPAGGQGQMSPLGADELAELQEALRRQLGEFMRKLGEGLGEIPQGFGQAERSMNDAVGALEQGQPGEATGPQGDALSQLQQGTENLLENLQQQLADGQGPGQPNARSMQQGQQDDRDPLDRRRAGYGDVDRSDIGIPSEIEAQRAREIFDELRRRASERDRPAIELDYIDRLLDRF